MHLLQIHLIKIVKITAAYYSKLEKEADKQEKIFRDAHQPEEAHRIATQVSELKEQLTLHTTGALAISAIPSSNDPHALLRFENKSECHQ